MVRRLASSVTRTARPQTQTRTATVLDVLAPTTDEADVATGWQLLLDFSGGEIRRAGVAGSYNPVPGDVVVVARYQNTLFVVDKVTAGELGTEPGGRVGYACNDVAVTGTTATSAVAGEIAVPGLTVTATLRHGGAYRVDVVCPFSVSVANAGPAFTLRKDTSAGAVLTRWFRVPVNVAGQVHEFVSHRMIRNDTGVDQTVAICLTASAPTGGTVAPYAATDVKPYIEVLVAGSSKLYPHAAPIPAPPEFTA